MGGVQGIVEELRKSAPAISGSLAVFGDWFGRPGDNFHTLVAVRAADDGCLVVGFDQGETLMVWAPEEISVARRALTIRRARRVRWEWYYYGGPQTAENRFFIEHALTDGRVDVTTNTAWPSRTFAPQSSAPAVQLG